MSGRDGDGADDGDRSGTGGDGDPTETGSPGIATRLVPDVVRRRFALKFGIVVAVMALSVGAVGVAATDQLRDHEREAVADRLRGTAAGESDTVERWVRRNRLATRLVSSDEVWNREDGLAIALGNRRARLPADVRGVHLVRRSLSGTRIVASTGLDPGTSLDGPRGWVADADLGRAGSVAVSDAYRAGGTPAVGFLSPVAAAGDRYLLVEVSVADLADSLGGAERVAGGFTQVVDADGTVVVDEGVTTGPGTGTGGPGPDALGNYTDGGPATEVLAAANALRGGSAVAGAETSLPADPTVLDEPYAVGYAPVAGTDWVVVTHAPTAAALGFVRQVWRWGLLVTVIAVVSVGAVGAAMGYRTASAIEGLTGAVDRMREGDLETEIEVDRIDSVGRLAEGLAEMRDALRRGIRETERARKEAEVARSEAVAVSEHLRERAASFAEVTGAAARGDLTRRMERDGENEAMDRIAAEFNGMIDELEKTIGQLESFADEVGDSGDTLRRDAESVRAATERLAGSAERIADSARAQRGDLRRLSARADELVGALSTLEVDDPAAEAAVGRSRELARGLAEAAEVADGMLDDAGTAADAAREGATDLEEVAARADRLRRYARPLRDVLGRFETDAEHEFVFSGGPSRSVRADDGDGEGAIDRRVRDDGAGGPGTDGGPGTEAGGGGGADDADDD